MGAYAEGESTEEDFSNLFLLQSVLSHNQFVRTSHIVQKRASKRGNGIH